LRLRDPVRDAQSTVTRPFKISLGVFASLLVILLVVSLMTFSGIPPAVRPHVYWLLWSKGYKRTVMASSSTKHQLLHVAWNGDGWGGIGGDWMGYIVYDPSDSLPQTGADQPPRKANGVPCEVFAIRRLEPKWYSVVTNMNQFWDSQHLGC
jgi:hypothetical protein